MAQERRRRTAYTVATAFGDAREIGQVTLTSTTISFDALYTRAGEEFPDGREEGASLLLSDKSTDRGDYDCADNDLSRRRAWAEA